MGKSLKYLMVNCADFIEEESLLQSMGHTMGATIDRTPKCHLELVGEGIKYSWACLKNECHLLPLGEQRSRDRFKECMRACLTPDVLKKESIRKIQGGHVSIYVYIMYFIISSSRQHKHPTGGYGRYSPCEPSCRVLQTLYRQS
jgi:hypothetical protein